MERAYRLRTIPPYPFREIAALKAEKIAKGEKLVDFGIGDPDQPTPEFVIEAMAEAIRDPETHRYDETGYGFDVYKDAIASHMRGRFGVELDTSNQIQGTIGCKEALVHIEWAYIDPGDILRWRGVSDATARRERLPAGSRRDSPEHRQSGEAALAELPE